MYKCVANRFPTSRIFFRFLVKKVQKVKLKKSVLKESSRILFITRRVWGKMSMTLLSKGLFKISSPIGTRTFTSTSITNAVGDFQRSAEQKQRQQDREQNKKVEHRKLLHRRTKARVPAAKSPFYLDTELALRYLRAAEVGRSPSEAVITVTSVIVADRGAPKLAGSIDFPKSLKEPKTLFFTTDEAQIEVAKKIGNITVGGEELIAQIKEGTLELEFDRAFATSDMTGKLSQVARQLGPKGLMPNAKRGTVIEDIESSLKLVSGSIPFRQKGDCLSVAVGRVNFTDKEIIENIGAASLAFKDAITSQKSKKASILGQTTLTSTHGPGIVIAFK